MRGKVWVNVNSWGGTGITPAYAGKRQQIQLALQAFEDHPRLCGEKLVQHFEHLFVLGSPPPMRGKAAIVWTGSRTSRITPAYAGKSVAPLGTDQTRRDHPRLCGEKCNVIISLFAWNRITPAYAGKRQTIQQPRQPAQDHPRLCGEKTGLSSILRTE